MSGDSKPRVFIGSSTEGLHYANAVFAELERDFEPVVWNQDIATPMSTILEDLRREAACCDFAVFVLTPDDRRISRRRERRVPRDNLLLEFGIFLGRLGPDGVFFLVPADHPTTTLPTDLAGLNQLRYSSRKDNNYIAAVRTACVRIKSIKRGLGPTTARQRAAVHFWHSISDRTHDHQDARTVLSSTNRMAFISGITLSYIVTNCRSQLLAALARHVRVEILIAPNEATSLSFYHRYCPFINDNLPLTYQRFDNFLTTLPEDGRRHIGCYASPIPLTHSIGLYDSTLYVSEFCIDCESARRPSYRIDEDSPSYEIFTSEVRHLLNEARPLFGSGASVIARRL